MELTPDLLPSGSDDPRRRLPSIAVVCGHPDAERLTARFGREGLIAALRDITAESRARLGRGDAAWSTVAEVLTEAARRLDHRSRHTLFGVINATGIVIHTNLGRAPLPPEAFDAIAATAGYGNLEFDLVSGRRASRHDHLEPLIAELSGAEAGLTVNNGAGAVLLVLAALAEGGPVIVSRGELIEIGGGFRVPDVVRQSGARLVEVGATNCTHLHDYEAAARDHPEARIILRTHPSNFRISGFTTAPRLADLAAFAHSRGMVLVEDLGGGALVDLSPYGIHGEPTVSASVQAGVDLVVFSGDKLLGGPQAGIIAGRRDLVAATARHPLARALRLDKLSLAALGATLRLYRAPSDPVARVPVLRMLTEPVAAVEARATALAASITGQAGLSCQVVATTAYAGGGAMPMLALPSRAVALMSRHGPEALALRLRAGAIRVVGRIESEQVLLDARTVADTEVAPLAVAVGQAAA